MVILAGGRRPPQCGCTCTSSNHQNTCNFCSRNRSCPCWFHMCHILIASYLIPGSLSLSPQLLHGPPLVETILVYTYTYMTDRLERYLWTITDEPLPTTITNRNQPSINHQPTTNRWPANYRQQPPNQSIQPSTNHQPTNHQPTTNQPQTNH